MRLDLKTIRDDAVGKKFQDKNVKAEYNCFGAVDKRLARKRGTYRLFACRVRNTGKWKDNNI